MFQDLLPSKKIPLRSLSLLGLSLTAAVAGVHHVASSWPALLALEALAASTVFPACIGVWLLSIPLADVSIIDIFWSLGFLLQSASVAVRQQQLAARQRLLLLLVAIWALRLAGYLTLRKVREEGREDPRYNDYVLVFKRGRHPQWLVALGSLGNPFVFQGFLMLVIGSPLVLTLGHPGGGSLGPGDALAALLWLLGFVFEAGGDWQLARFKAAPENNGRVLDRGFFAYTRHPNYFGDAVMWFAYWLFALCHVPQLAVWLLGCPLSMFVLLRYVSGAEMLDAELRLRRPQYRSYIDATSVFFPCPKRLAEPAKGE